MSPHIEIYDKKLGKNGRTLLFRQFRANLILTRLGSVESRIWGYLIFQMIGIIYKVKIKDSIIIPRVSRPNQVKLKVKMCSELYGDI